MEVTSGSTNEPAGSSSPPTAAGAVASSERSLHEVQLSLAVQYARLNELNAITARAATDTIGIVAAGQAYAEMRQALADMGLRSAESHSPPIRSIPSTVWFASSSTRICRLRIALGLNPSAPIARTSRWRGPSMCTNVRNPWPDSTWVRARASASGVFRNARGSLIHRPIGAFDRQ